MSALHFMTDLEGQNLPGCCWKGNTVADQPPFGRDITHARLPVPEVRQNTSVLEVRTPLPEVDKGGGGGGFALTVVGLFHAEALFIAPNDMAQFYDAFSRHASSGVVSPSPPDQSPLRQKSGSIEISTGLLPGSIIPRRRALQADRRLDIEIVRMQIRKEKYHVGLL